MAKTLPGCKETEIQFPEKTIFTIEHVTGKRRWWNEARAAFTAWHLMAAVKDEKFLADYWRTGMSVEEREEWGHAARAAVQAHN